MECSHPIAQRAELAVVHNHIVCNREPCRSRRLRSENLASLVHSRAISRLQPPQLKLFAAVDDQ